MHSLYLIAAISLDPATAGKILGEMTAVYGLLQGVKKTFPALTGKWAIVLNVAMSLIGAAVIIPPNTFFSMGTLMVVLLAGIQAAGSAGIHGTVQNVAPVALQTVLGQGPKVDAPQVNVSSGLLGSVIPPTKPNPYEDILK